MSWTDAPAKKRELWLARFFYFAYYGGLGCIFPFLNLFYTRVGLNGTQIGWTAAVGSMVALVAAPAWVRLSQERPNPRAFLQLSLALTVLAYLWLGQQRLFFWIVVATAARSLIGAGIGPLSDSMVLAVTGAARSGFGSVRVWGSLGWAVLVLFSGWLIQKTSLQSGFLSASAGYLLAALLLLWIGPAHFGKPRTPGDARPDTGSLLRSRALAGVGLMIVFTGFANSGVLQFEPVFMDRLGAREGLIGVASMLGSIVELPCMFWADRLADRRGSHFLLLLSMVVYAVLRAGVFLAPSIPAILLERAGGGVAFSFYAVSLVKFISEQAPQGQTGAALALFTVTLASLVNIIATPLTGMAYDRLGMTPLYALAALGYLGSWLALRLTYRTGEHRATGLPLLSSPAPEED